MTETKATKEALSLKLNKHLRHMPLLSLHCPQGWEYEPVSIVTAQSVTGTGLFSNIGSFITDALGRQSGMFIEKLREGEKICRSSLRYDSLRLGCDALIGVDVDYAEVGGTKAMLLVCMSGTAVRLRSMDVLEPSVAESVRTAKQVFEELDVLTPKTRGCSFCFQSVTEPAKPCDQATDNQLRTAASTIGNQTCREAMRKLGYIS